MRKIATYQAFCGWSEKAVVKTTMIAIVSGPSTGMNSNIAARIPSNNAYFKPINQKPSVQSVPISRHEISCARVYAASVVLTSCSTLSARVRQRPAFAFLVTPKLPLCGRSVKLDVRRNRDWILPVNDEFSNSTN